MGGSESLSKIGSNLTLRRPLILWFLPVDDLFIWIGLGISYFLRKTLGALSMLEE